MNETKPVSLDMRVRGLEQSATLAINERVRQLRALGRVVYNLGLGQSPFPVPDSVVEALRLAVDDPDLHAQASVLDVAGQRQDAEGGRDVLSHDEPEILRRLDEQDAQGFQP